MPFKGSYVTESRCVEIVLKGMSWGHARGMAAGRALPATRDRCAAAPRTPTDDPFPPASYSNFDICAFQSS